MTCGFLIQLVFCEKKTMWFIGVEVEQETSAPLPKKNPGSAPDSKVHPQKPIILREFYVICRSSNLKRNVGPKTKDFVTWQFYPKLTTFCRLCRSILITFWDCKIKFTSRTLSLWLHFLIGGFYSDTIAFVNDSCLRCPNGTFVPYTKAPGKSARECVACPQGKHILCQT